MESRDKRYLKRIIDEQFGLSYRNLVSIGPDDVTTVVVDSPEKQRGKLFQNGPIITAPEQPTKTPESRLSVGRQRLSSFSLRQDPV